MGDVSKLVFGTGIKQQVAARIQAHIETHFENNAAKAAQSLDMSRQRLFSYSTAKSLPRPAIFDVILQKWGLNLVEKPSRREGATRIRRVPSSRPVQRSLFDTPLTLTSDELKVVIRRKGPRLVASIEILTDVKIA